MSGSWHEDARLPPQPLDAATILRTLIAHGVEFILIGGLAVGAHGYPRATKDVDVVPAPNTENRRRLHDALVELAAEPLELGDFRSDELPVPFTAEGLDEGGNWALRTSAGRVDVMQWVPGLEEAFSRLRPRAIDADVPDVGRVLVAGYEDLVAMKRTAGRPQDVADISELERVREDRSF